MTKLPRLSFFLFSRITLLGVFVRRKVGFLLHKTEEMEITESKLYFLLVSVGIAESVAVDLTVENKMNWWWVFRVYL